MAKIIMFKKHKTPSLTQARKMSKDGYNERTKAVIDSCIYGRAY